mgnify:CR=1 FL=1
MILFFLIYPARVMWWHVCNQNRSEILISMDVYIFMWWHVQWNWERLARWRSSKPWKTVLVGLLFLSSFLDFLMMWISKCPGSRCLLSLHISVIPRRKSNDRVRMLYYGVVMSESVIATRRCGAYNRQANCCPELPRTCGAVCQETINTTILAIQKKLAYLQLLPFA